MDVAEAAVLDTIVKVEVELAALETELTDPVLEVEETDLVDEPMVEMTVVASNEEGLVIALVVAEDADLIDVVKIELTVVAIEEGVVGLIMVELEVVMFRADVVALTVVELEAVMIAVAAAVLLEVVTLLEEAVVVVADALEYLKVDKRLEPPHIDPLLPINVLGRSQRAAWGLIRSTGKVVLTGAGHAASAFICQCTPDIRVATVAL